MGTWVTVRSGSEVDGATSDARAGCSIRPWSTTGTTRQCRSATAGPAGSPCTLARLTDATRELFDCGLDAGMVRHRIRHALDGIRDASVRVQCVLRPEGDDAASVLVAVRPPVEPSGVPRALRSVPSPRPVPHLKHAGSFGQLLLRPARRAGQGDDALLTGPGGVVSEEGAPATSPSTTAPRWSGRTRPASPASPCNCCSPRLPGAGIATRRARVRLADLPSVAAAFVTSSHGVQRPWAASTGHADPRRFSALTKAIADVYESVDWDPTDG